MNKFVFGCLAGVAACVIGVSGWASAQGTPAPTQPVPAKENSRAQQLMGDIAPKLADLTDSVLFGDVWARSQLSRRDRSLVTVLARQNGLTEEELVEAITHLAFYSGWPNAITAVGVAREVFAKK